jgi:hypothetical protein
MVADRDLADLAVLDGWAEMPNMLPNRSLAIMWGRMRRFAILGLVASVLLGLASRKLGPTGFVLWDKSFGDADYAVMFGFLLLALRPTLSQRVIGLGAFGICFALELFQLTGIPWRAPEPLRFLLGQSFGWSDVACYGIGAAAVAAIVHVRNKQTSTLR